MTVTTAQVLQDIEVGIQTAEGILPQVISIASVFYPQAAAITPFLGLLQAALQAVTVVQSATGNTVATATADVINTLTPGAPNAPSLVSVSGG